MMKGPAKKLAIYVEETEKYGGRPVYEALLDVFHRRKILGVSVFRGVAGFGSDGIVHTAKMLELSTKMPVKIEVIDSAEMIERVLPDVYQIVGKGFVEVSDTTIIKYAGTEGEAPEEGEKMKLKGKAKLLRIIVSEDDKWEGEALYEAIVKRLMLHDIAGATVYKAVAGYGPHKRYHKKKALTPHGEVPVMITVIDADENINRVIPILDDMVSEGIVVLSEVTVIKYTHRDAKSEML